jgi:glutamyl-tRNA synthetase/nondiscriminating glutamyl-tRNA synthetase
LHLGNARTALFNWLVARQQGGALVLRIEDTDVDRHEEGSEAGILEDLRWLGLDWDEGPDVGGPAGPYRQSERGPRYRKAADGLVEGGHAYRCFCDEAPADARRVGSGAEACPGRCHDLPVAEGAARAEAGEAFAVRLRARSSGLADGDGVVRFHDRLRGPIEVDGSEIADPVLLRRDGRPTYNFAVVVDDAAMDIDLVLRGDDHLSNTPRQVLLYRALGQPLPEFVHLPMVRGTDGSRLSKRHGAVSLAEFRERGYPREALLNALALLGWAPPGGERSVVTVDELLAEFDLGRVNRAPAAFDPEKLDWISAQHIQSADATALARSVGERLVTAGRIPGEGVDPAWLAGIAEMLRTKLERLDQVPERAAALFADGGEPEDPVAREALAGPEARQVVEALARLAAALDLADPEAWPELKRSVKQASGVKGRALFQPLRVAITGALSGPELDRLVPLIARGHAILPERVVTVAERARRTLGWMP